MLSSCFLFKQKTAYEMRISDWSSDVCSSDLAHGAQPGGDGAQRVEAAGAGEALAAILADDLGEAQPADAARPERRKLRFVEALVRDADAAPRHGITGEIVRAHV